MQHRRSFGHSSRFILLAAITLSLAACTQHATTTPGTSHHPGTPPGLQITPASITLGANQSRTLSANDANVTWTATGGSIRGQGTSITYTAPGKAGTYTITATRNHDRQQVASATVTVSASSTPAPPATITWVRQPPDITALNDVGTDASGNVYVVGSKLESSEPCSFIISPPFCSTDAYVAKYNPSGELQWSTTLGVPRHSEFTPRDEFAYDLGVDGAGNVYILASNYDLANDVPGDAAPNPDRVTFAKFDSGGRQVWLKQFRNIRLQDVAVAPTGDVLVLGQPDQGGLTAPSPFVRRYDASGALQSEITLEGLFARIEVANDFYRYNVRLALDETGSLYLAGTDARHRNIRLMKLDATGTNIWTRHFADERPSVTSSALSMTVANDGVYLTWASGVNSNLKGFLKKYDTSGRWQWNKEIPLPRSVPAGVPDDPSIYELGGFAAPLTTDPAGNVYAAVTVFTNVPARRNTAAEIYLRKYSPAGTPLGVAKLSAIPSENRAQASAITSDANGTIYTTGQTEAALEGTTPEGPRRDEQGFLVRWDP